MEKQAAPVEKIDSGIDSAKELDIKAVVSDQEMKDFFGSKKDDLSKKDVELFGNLCIEGDDGKDKKADAGLTAEEIVKLKEAKANSVNDVSADKQDFKPDAKANFDPGEKSADKPLDKVAPKDQLDFSTTDVYKDKLESTVK